MKQEKNFKIFIISRFLVMMIIVILSEFIVFCLMAYVSKFWLQQFPILQLILTLILYAVPIVGTAVWFSRIISQEVLRMEKKQEELRLQYERARNLMLSDIAHDLRTPITTIAGYSKALNDGMVTSDEKRREYLEAIENKSERMSDLINLLFEYVRLESDNFSLRKTELDLTELLRENAALLYADIEEKGMDFEIDIPEEPCMASVDRLQFSRVITNLINNALKHNEAGTQVVLQMQKRDGEIEISLSDNGTLISPLIADHIFEPFVVADASRESKGGSGLGLSIAKKIVEMHGGSIHLKQDYEERKKSFIINLRI